MVHMKLKSLYNNGIMLDTFFFTIDGNYKGSDCNLAFNKEGECFTATLKNEVGDILVVDGDANEFNDMMVAVELTDYYEEESQLSKTKIYPRRKP